MKNLKKLLFICITPLIALVLASCTDSREKAGTKEEQQVLTSASGTVYKIDPDQSKLEWEASKVTGKHNGVVDISGGELAVENDAINSGRFAIDMTTITVLDIESPESNQKLTNHLKSDDFFSAESHPQAIFEITGIQEQNDGTGNTHIINGNLTIKGITNNIAFPARIDVTENNVHAAAEFKIDRTQWDVKFRSGKFFENLGDNLIHDDFTIKFDIMAQR